jgi:hypothetical protein
MDRRAVQPAASPTRADLLAPEVSTEAGWSWTRAGDLASETIAPYPNRHHRRRPNYRRRHHSRAAFSEFPRDVVFVGQERVPLH